jgi:hypothetical protein
MNLSLVEPSFLAKDLPEILQDEALSKSRHIVLTGGS